MGATQFAWYLRAALQLDEVLIGPGRAASNFNWVSFRERRDLTRAPDADRGCGGAFDDDGDAVVDRRMVVALDDCTKSVAMAPQKAPRSGVAAALPSPVRSAEPASAFRPPVMTVMPSRNRPTPPRIEIVVDMGAPELKTTTLLSVLVFLQGERLVAAR
jgi:hypothetical protein